MGRLRARPPGPSSSAVGKNLDTVLGRVRVPLAYHHCPVCHYGVPPRDRDLGVEEQSLSPRLRRMLARTAAVESFAGAASLLTDLAGVTRCTKRIERAAEADGQTAAQALAVQSRAILSGTVRVLPPAELPDTLYIEVDRTGLPMVPAAVFGRAGKGGDGQARTPRGQTRLPVHPDQVRRARPARTRSGHRQLRAHPRPCRGVHHPRARRGADLQI